MKNILKSVGILTIIAIIPGAFAATSRVGVYTKAGTRGSSLSSFIAAKTLTPTSTVVSSSTATTILSDIECVDNYSECIRGGDACGSEMEECTTNVLLHAKMPKCISTLMQCSSSGVMRLFGNGDIATVGSETGATKNSYGEITKYAYPTEGSVLGQMVAAAKIENVLPSEQCSKKYTKCLQKDSVCGEDFELCTDQKEFKKQALSCASTLARCDGAGKTMLFGDVANADTLRPAAKSVLHEMIQSGADLAARNAVATCYRVTDQCILNACAKNPNKCIEGIDETLIRIGDSFDGGRAVSPQDVVAMGMSMGASKRDVNKFIENACRDTVASNKYCYMVATGKQPKKDTVNLPDDEKDEVFSDIYAGTDGMDGRYSKLRDQIVQLWDDFNADAQKKCVNTIASCAMRSCGSGLGSVCFNRASAGNGIVHINGDKTYSSIENGCSAIVGNEAACQYSARFSFIDMSNVALVNIGTSNVPGRLNAIISVPKRGKAGEVNVFSTLFPKYTGSESDPIGAVGVLNSTLATSYNAAAIADLREQCKNTAVSCIRAMCGKDYTNCYRNRTDIVSSKIGAYESNSVAFDKSMNKMGGVLDYNIVMGLCLDTVTSADSCSEHLKIAASDMLDEVAQDKKSWGADSSLTQYDSVRDGWLGANTTKVARVEDKYLIACAVKDTIGNCTAGDRMLPENGKCGKVDEDGCVYSEPVYQDQATYVLENAGKTLFQELLDSEERRVQGLYNAKLTKEQNVCLHNDENKGIMGSTDNGSTYMWVKLKSSKIPKDYPTKGLTTKQFQATGDLYGAFCRARITVMSDDKDIQAELGSDATAYFAVGDTFTCGSWIDQKTLSKIAERVGKRAVCREGYGQWDTENGTCSVDKLSTKEKTAYAWATIGGALGLGTAGFFGMDALQRNGASLGGLLDGDGLKATKNKATQLGECAGAADKAEEYFSQAQRELNAGNQSAALTHFDNAVSKANQAMRAARLAGKDVSRISFGYGSYVDAVTGSCTYNASFVSVAAAAAKNADNDACKDATDTLNNIVSAGYSAGVDVTSLLATAKTACSSDSKVKHLVNSMNCDNKTCMTCTESKSASSLSSDTNYTNFETNLNTLKNVCKYESDDDKEERRNKNLIAGSVMTAVGGALGAGITASVLKNKKENIKNEEMFKFMDEIGEHITCYLGGTELGNYGDAVSFSID